MIKHKLLCPICGKYIENTAPSEFEERYSCKECGFYCTQIDNYLDTKLDINRDPWSLSALRSIYKGAVRWHPVKMQLPQEDIKCIVVDEGEVKIAEYNTSNKQFRVVDCGFYMPSFTVTHWMAMPELPEGE